MEEAHAKANATSPKKNGFFGKIFSSDPVVAPDFFIFGPLCFLS
jgi:hypothetical protein